MNERLSVVERADRAAEARSILNSEIFKTIFKELQAQFLEELIQAPVGDLTAQAAHARIKALEEVRTRLHSYRNDEHFINKGM